MGRAVPARHSGSVDVFLEALQSSRPGDVLVIDNGGLLEEACIGDLIALEAKNAGIAGIVLWGTHRDTVELLEIDLPVFSYGSFAPGPTQFRPRDPDALRKSRFGSVVVTHDDVVFGDDDGVLFMSESVTKDVLAAAQAIWKVEREQARRIRTGDSLREQTDFGAYLDRRSIDPHYTFRQHLREVNRAIEE